MLTLEEKACNYETMRHIEKVRENLNFIVKELLVRGEEHDQSKMESPEVEAFAKAPCLDEIKYDSPEYKKSKADLGEALEHHYANNRHHIPHHKNGIRDMNLIDVVEMFCDWKASSERMKAGNILKSIEINAVTYGLSPDLVAILENTAKLMD